MLNFLNILARGNELSTVSALAQLHNISFKSNKVISKPFLKHPIFSFSRTNAFSSFSLLSTSFRHVASHVVYSKRGNIQVKNCEFFESISPIYVDSLPLNKSRQLPKNSQQRDYKGRIRAIGKNVTFIQCSFHALSSSPGVGFDRDGGAVFCKNSFINFTDCLFAGNRASSGGACYFHNSTVYLQDCNFSLNKATNDGGAICSEYTNATIINCNFVKNQADMSAGAFSCKNSVLFAENTLFQENMDFSKSGAIDAESSKIHLESVQFKDNKCKFKSGGIIINLKKSSAELYACMINSKSKKAKAPIKCEDNLSVVLTKGTCFDVSLEDIKKKLTTKQFQESSTNKYGESCPIRAVQVQQPYDVIVFNVNVDSSIFTKDTILAISSLVVIATLIACFMLIKVSKKKTEYTKA